MKKFLSYTSFIFCLFGLVACSSSPSITSAERSQMRTKTFEANYDTTFRSLMIVLENHGYTIDNTDMNSGLIKATISKNTGNEVASAFSTFFLGFGTTGIANYDLSATVSKVSANVTRVRINIRQKEATRNSVSANDIDDPEIYQIFFNDLRVEVQRMQALN